MRLAYGRRALLPHPRFGFLALSATERFSLLKPSPIASDTLMHCVYGMRAEIAMFENNIVIYKFAQDLHFFVTGGDDENELIISTVLQGFFDAVGLLLRGNVDKKEALENLDLILLCLDEIVDGGIILETDANVIAGKVASHSVDSGAPLSEQCMRQFEAIQAQFLDFKLGSSAAEGNNLETRCSVLMSVILNRTLVIPPVLDHHAVVLGSCPKYRLSGPKELRYVSVIDISSLVSESAVRVIDFRHFVSLFCDVNINYFCSKDSKMDFFAGKTKAMWICIIWAHLLSAPKDQKIQSLINKIEFLPFVPEILDAGKGYALHTIKSPFVCATSLDNWGQKLPDILLHVEETVCSCAESVLVCWKLLEADEIRKIALKMMELDKYHNLLLVRIQKPESVALFQILTELRDSDLCKSFWAALFRLMVSIERSSVLG
ncbi:coatomer subunit zeta-1-like protein [Tanacetum coccineum]|uniref:Coatomer subunit zeta-1-like protein n=1 Tax=Tanacetum coccineum TaxID=301880 RepID=A0ABQ5EYK3_9ASTR